jgi:2'-5' RNA ligase
VQAAIEAHRKDWIWPKGHYFPRGPRLHLTLHCFGDQPKAVEKRLCERSPRFEVQPMNLVLDFTHMAQRHRGAAARRARRAAHPAESRAVQKAGIVTETPTFTPHITIARRPRARPIR